MAKLNFRQPFLQCSTEIILKCWFGAQEIELITNNSVLHNIFGKYETWDFFQDSLINIRVIYKGIRVI